VLHTGPVSGRRAREPQHELADVRLRELARQLAPRVRVRARVRVRVRLRVRVSRVRLRVSAAARA